VKKRSEPFTVALKKLKSSENKMEAFINEVNFFNFNLIYCVYYFINYFVYQCKILCKCNNWYAFIKLYGITKDPQTEEFIMVLQFAEYGNLRNYLKNNINNLNWNEKLNILYGIAYNLHLIHYENYVHKDLHGGNILQFNYDTEYKYENTKITDLGQAQFINNSKNSNTTNVCGVLPYIAPEVLDGKPYTKKSDIYSFGIIMVEVSTGKPPYLNIPHDGKLALAICNGLRPRVAKGTPQCYIDLVNKCLDAIPEKRPTANKLISVIDGLKYRNRKEFIDANEANKIIQQESSFETTSHSEAVYTSRLMKFNNLPKPINTTRVRIEDSEGIIKFIIVIL
jgi:serine/threonine protein kinase